MGPNFQLQKLQVSVCISTTKKKTKSENVRIPKFGKFPTTISAKYQNGSFTIIHSSLCISCMHIDDKKKTKSEKVQKSENVRITKSRNFQTILAKFQNGRLTIIHSSLCSSCIHIDGQKKPRSPKKFKVRKCSNSKIRKISNNYFGKIPKW